MLRPIFRAADLILPASSLLLNRRQGHQRSRRHVQEEDNERAGYDCHRAALGRLHPCRYSDTSGIGEDLSRNRKHVSDFFDQHLGRFLPTVPPTGPAP